MGGMVFAEAVEEKSTRAPRHAPVAGRGSRPQDRKEQGHRRRAGIASGWPWHSPVLPGAMVGYFYLLFVWTFIPSIAAFIEGIVFLCTGDAAWEQKYG